MTTEQIEQQALNNYPLAQEAPIINVMRRAAFIAGWAACEQHNSSAMNRYALSVLEQVRDNPELLEQKIEELKKEI